MSEITQKDLDQIKLITKEEYDSMQSKIKLLEEDVKQSKQQFLDWMNTSETVVFITKGDSRLFIVNPPSSLRDYVNAFYYTY